MANARTILAQPLKAAGAEGVLPCPLPTWPKSWKLPCPYRPFATPAILRVVSVLRAGAPGDAAELMEVASQRVEPLDGMPTAPRELVPDYESGGFEMQRDGESWQAFLARAPLVWDMTEDQHAMCVASNLRMLKDGERSFLHRVLMVWSLIAACFDTFLRGASGPCRRARLKLAAEVRGFQAVDGAPPPPPPAGAPFEDVLAHKILATKAVLACMMKKTEEMCEQLEELYAASGVALVAKATMEPPMRTEPKAPLGATKLPCTMARPVGHTLTPRELYSEKTSSGPDNVVQQPKRGKHEVAARKEWILLLFHFSFTFIFHFIHPL